MSDRTCLGCGALIAPHPRERNKRLWCSGACRARKKRSQGKQSQYAPRSAVSYAWCAECGVLFTVHRAAREGNKGLVCRSGRCGNVRSSRLQREWMRRYRALNGKAYTSGRYDAQRREYGRKRRAMCASVEYESFDALEIFERDGWKCQLCGDPVDSSLMWPDPMYPTLDHCTPVSRGGPHTRANCQLAHMVCNARKSNQMEGEASWLDVDPDLKTHPA